MNNAEWAYFDYAATTPPDEHVLARYMDALRQYYANSGSNHALGLATKERLEEARACFAACVGAQAAEIVFTSGATESNNLALKGAVGYRGAKNPRIITLQTEHKAILDTAAALAGQGVAVEVLPVAADGLIDLSQLEETLAKSPATLVSTMAVNNETGVVQPLRQIADLAHQYGAKFHVDAAQALGKMPVSVSDWDADMVSFSGHKVYAPKGIGALYVRRLPKMRLATLQHGGGQERGRRSGTMPVALIMAFTEAVEIATNGFHARYHQVDKFAETLVSTLPQEMAINGGVDFSLEKQGKVPHILSIDTGLSALDVLTRANQAKLALSAGSACQTAQNEGSHVLKAMGLHEASTRSLRVSLSHLTTKTELERLQQFLAQL